MTSEFEIVRSAIERPITVAATSVRDFRVPTMSASALLAVGGRVEAIARTRELKLL